MAVPREEATATDFMMVRAALVRRVGGANEALVWTRIQWRHDVATKSTYRLDGEVWWPATREEIATEVGLSPDQVKRAISALVAGGFIETAQHRRAGNYDRTNSYRVLIEERPIDWAESPNESGEIAQSDRAESPNVPSTETVKTKPKNVGKAAVTTTEGSRSARELCEALSRAIVANGSKEPTISAAWLSAARLLVDRDKRSPQQVRNMIAWCQADEFWRGNVLSMPTLRAKYDQMRLQAMRSNQTRGVVATGQSLVDQIRAREAARQAESLSHELD